MFYCSEISGQLTLDGADTTKSTYQSAGFGNSYSFKFEDLNGQVHRFNCGEWTSSWEKLCYNLNILIVSVATNILCIKPRPCNFSLFPTMFYTYKNLQFAFAIFVGSEHQEELVSAVMQRIGAINDGERPTLMVCFTLL
jgi:hypothetical protein